MKHNRHYFYKSISIINTAIFSGIVILLLFALIMSICFNPNCCFVFGILFILFFPVGFILLHYDGWKSWEIIGKTIVVKQIFKKKRTINLYEIDLIKPVQLEVVNLLSPSYFDFVDGYSIVGNSFSIDIAKSKDFDDFLLSLKNYKKVAD